MFNRVSLDGCFAAPDGGLGCAVPDPEIDRAAAAGTPAVDTFLFGRKTYELLAGFWPKVDTDAPAAPDPHRPGHTSPEQRAFAIALNSLTKLVFSRRLKEATWNNSRVVRDLDPRAIEALKRQPGKDMILLGSGSIVTQLTRHGLIDEYQLVVSPVVLGGGQSLFGELASSARLELLEAKPYGSGNIMLRYARAG